jgi:hypothetical protein
MEQKIKKVKKIGQLYTDQLAKMGLISLQKFISLIHTV